MDEQDVNLENLTNVSSTTIFGVALLSGACAGLAVDVSLFPLDTIKTRLQSSIGFQKSGGFRHIYSGLGSVVIGSCPGAATFFCTYEFAKLFLSPYISTHGLPVVHMIAAASGEIVSCVIRVPTEVIKQRTQAGTNVSSWRTLKTTLKSEGFLGLYRGYRSTVLREIPFAFIQYPIWEHLKKSWSLKQGYNVRSWQSALCGGVAGGIAAAMTTPIDVAKTRIMLASKKSMTAKGNIIHVMHEVWHTKGTKGLFAGIGPRVLWITLGGMIFFGVYEKSKDILSTFTSL